MDEEVGVSSNVLLEVESSIISFEELAPVAVELTWEVEVEFVSLDVEFD